MKLSPSYFVTEWIHRIARSLPYPVFRDLSWNKLGSSLPTAGQLLSQVTEAQDTSQNISWKSTLTGQYKACSLFLVTKNRIYWATAGYSVQQWISTLFPILFNKKYSFIIRFPKIFYPSCSPALKSLSYSFQILKKLKLSLVKCILICTT